MLTGVGRSAVALLLAVPAGVLADRVSRKWSLVVSYALTGPAMMATRLVGGFGAPLATPLRWGLAWTFASGADVAWISDELATGSVALVLVDAGPPGDPVVWFTGLGVPM
ncbi:hypothetical protein [Cryptosporangium arvum]|uniref:hypothetical protein n=1 Tax=Cryptosporangium arvum TaxID=80871 RepID=UPI0004BC7DE9|nr:hypothetical protein [Cryptosporangium arvum]